MAMLNFPNLRWRRTLASNEAMFLGSFTVNVAQELNSIVLYLVKEGGPTFDLQLKLHTVNDINKVYALSNVINYSEIDWINNANDYYGKISFSFTDYPNLNTSQGYWISLELTNYVPDNSNFISTVFDYPDPHNYTYADSPHNISEYPKMMDIIANRSR